MKTFSTLAFAFLLSAFANTANAQTAMDFNTLDCAGNPVHLFADLDAGKAVVLFYYMPSCGSCPPPAQKIQAMANNINASYPGMVKGYAFPFQNTTTCSYSNSWVSTNGLPLYAPMDSGATSVAYYGGFGMPTVVLVGGSDHRVMFKTLSFTTSDTTEMRDSILALLGSTEVLAKSPVANSFDIYPNPASEQITVDADLNQSGQLKIEVLDLEGRQVAILMDEQKSAGMMNKNFNLSTMPAGNYIVRMSLNGESISKQINIVR